MIRKSNKRPARGIRAVIAKGTRNQIAQKFDVIVSRDVIITQPSENVEYDLDTLINGIYPSNVRAESSFGLPIGNEAL